LVTHGLKDYHTDHHYYFPYPSFISQIEKFVEKNSVSDDLKEAIKGMKRTQYGNKESQIINKRIEDILNGKTSKTQLDLEDCISEKDNIGVMIGDFFRENHETEGIELLLKVLTDGLDKSAPTQKWVKEATAVIEKIGVEKIRDFTKVLTLETTDLLAKLHKTQDVWQLSIHREKIFEYDYSQNDKWFSSKNELILKNLIWLTPYIYDKTHLDTISELGLVAYKKYSGIGPLLLKVGSACIYAMAQLPNQEGISYLTRYGQKIKNNNANKTIEKYLQELALKSGKTTFELEEEAILTFGLDSEHRFTTVMGNFTAISQITSNNKVETTWQDSKGKTYKSAPLEVKMQFATDVKALNLKVKTVQDLLNTQAQRMEQSYLQDRHWTYKNWSNLYQNVGILTYLGKKLIWEFEGKGNKITGFYKDGQIVDDSGHPLSISDDTTVKLWHPINDSLENVANWRNFLMNNLIVQPFKQAFREIYILTDAEVNTRMYSNRFAAHILKNYQFGALCKTREWLGYNQFHDGGIPRKTVKSYKIAAEFWTNYVDSMDYVATDQVRFYKNNEQMALVDVPPIVLSELMRDVDLFVGVCSIGNDPNWVNGGRNYGEYWQSYSFGELGETAKTRKSILENILPKLKIAKVATLEDKFLVVKGTYRTYKIHLGSTNILMAPNDQYLCIVPDRSKSKEQNLYLPFEGDTGLSVIISKAFLLAEDSKITDSTITSQIHRK
jgi:Domain of unknown function (DUF4132)